jgi:glycogen debranching enzyme
MMRQVFYPPEGKSNFNYYVFSREPTWGWGHGGQVFHESLTIPAYALLDPESAMNSQRVYSQRQYDNGYINYRTGAYLDEIIEYEGQLTSSAPWYNFQNWELFEVTHDKVFLTEMYESGKRFYNFYVSNRDLDKDGLCEWGGHAVLESVRDANVAVWDEVGWPSNFEAVDLNCMLVMEAKSLEKMARELDLEVEAETWKQDWTERSQLINEVFWDQSTGFYYHADRTDNDFSYKHPDDLKREEIIGFLPLWAGVADEIQAATLLEKLKDPTKFWRKYGVPSLSADDSYYNDKGYWNGPVWVEWNYLIVKALLDYGYIEEARELTRNVANGMIFQLKQNHNLWEFYSPDTTWAGYHKTYIWAGIINKMIVDVQEKSNEPL